MTIATGTAVKITGSIRDTEKSRFSIRRVSEAATITPIAARHAPPAYRTAGEQRVGCDDREKHGRRVVRRRLELERIDRNGADDGGGDDHAKGR